MESANAVDHKEESGDEDDAEFEMLNAIEGAVDDDNIDPTEPGNPTDDVDALYDWCESHGFVQHHEKIVDELGIETIEDILDSDMSDLMDICHDLAFTDEESKKFLSVIMEHKNSNNAENELKVWCKDNKVDEIYDKLIDLGYFTVAQLSALSKEQRTELCKQLKLKYGKKTRFLSNIPSQNMAPSERKLIMVDCDKTVVTEDSCTDDLKSDGKDDDDDDDAKNNHVQGHVRIESNAAVAKMNKSVMFIGETGSGKTTTINSMMNYLFHADFDGHRYELIRETHKQKELYESMTDDVILYEISPTAIDYQLTIIDCPGFGDTKGLEVDKKTNAKIKRLFETRVTEIDAIFFVLKASQSRLTERQSYVFNEVLNIFGNDIADNIILLFTFADESVPVALHCVKGAHIPHREKFVKINNSAFAFDLNAQNRSLFDTCLLRFAELFEDLETIQTKSLQLTREVLTYRNNLKMMVQNVKRKLNDGLLVYETLKQRIQYTEDHKDEINGASSDHDNQMATIYVPSVTRVIEKNGAWFSSWRRKTATENQMKNKQDNIASQDRLKSFLVCEHCQYTCGNPHEWRNIINNGFCSQCPGWCDMSKHKVAKYKYESCLVEKKVPIKKLENGYYDASIDQPKSDQLIDKYTTQLKECERDLVEMIMKMRVYINKIKELALNKHVLTPLDYIEDLIQSEQTQHKAGYQERVKALQAIQRQEELLNRISADVNQRDINSLFPEFAEILEYHKSQEENEHERSRQRGHTNALMMKEEKNRRKTTNYREESRHYFIKQKVYNRTYNDFLKDFQGHIIETEEIDRSGLFPLNTARFALYVSKFLCADENIYRRHIKHMCKRMEFERSFFVPKGATACFSDAVRWVILYPTEQNKKKRAVYLVFKGASDLLELAVNVFADPQKLYTNDSQKSDLVSVHGNIYLALMTQFEHIMLRLKALKIGQPECQYDQLIIGGHCMGGGLAILFGYEMIRRQLMTWKTLQHTPVWIVTFGAPPVIACDHTLSQGLIDSTEKLIEADDRIQLLDGMCHCFVNRMDPVPRIMTLVSNEPDLLRRIFFKMTTKKLRFYQPTASYREKIKAAITGLSDKKLENLYFTVGKQYIWCGKAEKWYMDEQMKVRVKRDIVCTFDKDCKLFALVPVELWAEMFGDHDILLYKRRLDGKTTLID